jgi:hypothetical protein
MRIAAAARGRAGTIWNAGLRPGTLLDHDGTNYGVIENLHQAVMHALAPFIRQSRLSADAISTTVF